MAIAFLVTALASQASALVVRGVVRSGSDGKPLPGSSVQIATTGLGVAAGIDGGFLLAGISPGDWTVTASHLGYESESREVTLAGDTVTVDFTLEISPIKLGEMVFTGTRTMQLLKNVPVATEVVRSDEIRDHAAVTASQALETEIGLDVQEDFSGQGVTLQGIDPDKVLILVDGNRVVGRVNGSIDLDQIAAGGIKQIEVVKGAVSTLYGSEALGGVVNIITEPAKGPFSLLGNLEYGGYMPNNYPDRSGRLLLSRNQGQGLSLGLRRNITGFTNTFHHSLTGLIDIDPTTTHTEGIDAADRYNDDARIDIDLAGPSDIILTGHYMNEEKSWVENAGLESVEVSYNDRETNSNWNSAAEFVCTPNDDDRYSAKLYSTGNHHNWRKLTLPPYNQVTDFSRGDEDFSELSLLMTRRPHPQHLVTVGADGNIWGITASSELGGIPSRYSSDLTAWDAFLQDDWRPGDGFALLPGLRYERHEVYGDHWSPRLSVMRPLGEDLTLRVSAGFGYRAPSAKELYFTFNHASAGYIVYGNPDLKPEESRSYSINLEHTYKNSAVARLSFFYNDLRNLIDFDSVGATDQYYTGIYRYGNIVSAWTAGAELEREFRINLHMTGKVAYSYMDTRNRGTGTMLIRRPTHSARWNIDWHRRKYTVALWGRFTGRMLYQSIFRTNAQVSNEWTEPYHLWNASVTRDLGRGLSAYAKAENIFDFTNPKYGPREGRVLTAGVRWSYGQ